MKKFLLTTIILLISTAAFAQKNYNIKEAEEVAKINHAPALVTSYKGRRVYYDYLSNQYLLEEHFAKKYGRKTIELLDRLYVKGQLWEFKEPDQVEISQSIYRDNRTNRNNKEYKLKLRTGNLVVGGSLIGVSAATYMLSNSIIDNKVKNLGKDLAEKEIKLDDYNSKIESLDKTKRTMGYICAGTSLAGVIVVLTGLHKEYAQGVNLGHNFTVSDYGAGISLTKKF